MQRFGQFLLFRDCDGVRHLVRIGSVQVLSDADVDCQECLLVVANRMYRVPVSLECCLEQLDPGIRIEA